MAIPNNISTPSFGAALSVMRKSLSTNTFQFNRNSQNPGVSRSEQEILTSLALTNSNDISQDPTSRHLSIEMRQPNTYLPNLENDLNKEASQIRGDSETKKFSGVCNKKMINQPGGDENSDISPDEANGENRQQSSPLQLIRLESIFGKDAYLSPIRSHAQNSIIMDQPDQKDLNNAKNKVSIRSMADPKENIFKRGLKRLKGAFLGRRLKQGTVKQEANETNINITIHRSEIQGSNASFSAWSPFGESEKIENGTKGIGKDLEEEKIHNDYSSMKIIEEDVTSPKKLSRSRIQNSESVSKLDEALKETTHINIVGVSLENIQSKTHRSYDLSLGNSPYVSNRSPNERRRASFGQNLQQVQEKTVEQAFKWRRALKLVMQIIALTLFLVITFIFLTLLSSIITYPFQKLALHLWVGQFLHGFFLGMLSFSILKIMIRGAREIVQKEEETALGKDSRVRGIEHDVDINIFGFLLLISSGFLMVLLVHIVNDAWSNSFCFVGLEIIVLIINMVLITVFFIFKNYHESKAVQGKQKQGFFFIPIYKYFMSDLTHTRHELTNNPEALSPNSRSNQEKKAGLKEEGIDKFKPKRSFEILTITKVFTSQIFLIILYIQFLVIISFIKLYNLLQEVNYIVPAIPVVLIYPQLIYLFYKILKLVDQRKKMGMLFHISYINTSLASIFFRTIVLRISSYEFMWLIIGCKIGYKLLIYIIYGCYIPFWKAFIKRIKSSLQKRHKHLERAESVLKPFSQATIIELSRVDTFTSKQMREIEKQEDSKKEKVENKTVAFVLRFVLVQTSEITYSAASLVLFACYNWNNMDYVSTLLNAQVKDMYFTATWTELIFEVVLLVVVGICWTFNKAYNFLPIRQVFRYFFSKLAIDFINISLPLLITYLFLLRF